MKQNHASLCNDAVSCSGRLLYFCRITSEEDQKLPSVPSTGFMSVYPEYPDCGFLPDQRHDSSYGTPAEPERQIRQASPHGLHKGFMGMVIPMYNHLRNTAYRRNRTNEI